MLALSSLSRCGPEEASGSPSAPDAASGTGGVWLAMSVRATSPGRRAFARDQLVGDAQDVFKAATANAVLAVHHHGGRGVDAAADDELLGARDLCVHGKAVDGALQLARVGALLGHPGDDVIAA